MSPQLMKARSMSRRSRLAIGVGAGLTIGFLALIVIVGTTVWLVERGNRLFDQSTLQRMIRVTAVDLRDDLRTAESSQRGFLLTGNEIYVRAKVISTARHPKKNNEFEVAWVQPVVPAKPRGATQ